MSLDAVANNRSICWVDSVRSADISFVFRTRKCVNAYCKVMKRLESAFVSCRFSGALVHGCGEAGLEKIAFIILIRFYLISSCYVLFCFVLF